MHCLVIQQVEEVFDSQGDGAAGAEDHLEQVVYKLLQRSLEIRWMQLMEEKEEEKPPSAWAGKESPCFTQDQLPTSSVKLCLLPAVTGFFSSLRKGT